MNESEPAKLDQTPATEGAPAGQASEPPQPGPGRRAETVVALVLTALIVGLHVVRWAEAGCLWRDEAAAVQLATLPTVREVAGHFQHEAFPLLFPMAVRAVAAIAGDSDLGFRTFGLLVGLSIIGALWWNLWLVRRSVPLLALALLGFNGAFLQWGDSVRGYGLGTVFILLTVGLVWRVVEQPTPARIAAAALAAIGSVQCHLHNPALVLAIGLAGAATALRWRRLGRAAVVLLIGAAAGVSLLPYWAPLRAARDWDILVRSPVNAADLWRRLSDTLSASGWSNTWVWVILVFGGLVLCLIGQFRTLSLRQESERRDLRLFAGTALALGAVACFGFLAFLRYNARPWYFLAWMAFTSLLLDFVFETFREHRWARGLRLVLPVLVAGASLPLAWEQAQTRQSNVDLIAAKLCKLADKQDLVVVAPWHQGISFQRYYTGAAPWMTVPPIAFHKFHRYDLIKPLMIMPDQNEPIRPLLRRIDETLRSGRRVWVAGVLAKPKPGNPPIDLPPAPDRQWGWQDQAYSLSWSMNTEAHLRNVARKMENVPVECGGRVNPLEDLPLVVYDGWSK